MNVSPFPKWMLPLVKLLATIQGLRHDWIMRKELAKFNSSRSQ